MRVIAVLVAAALLSVSLTAAAVARGDHDTGVNSNKSDWASSASNWGTAHCNKTDQSGCIPKQ